MTKIKVGDWWRIVDVFRSMIFGKKIAETKTVEEGKQAAQSYHNQRVNSLFTV